MFHPNRPVAAICLAVASAFVQAQEATYEFDIPAQPVSQVLAALAKQTGLQPFFAEEAVKGVQSAGIKGKFGLREALAKALAGTGLTFQFTSEKAVAIKLAPVEKVVNLPTIEVKEVVEKGYAVKRATTATKTDTPLMQTPMTVEVLPRQMLQEMGVVSLGISDVVKYSGVTTQGTGPLAEDLYYRGFNSSTTLWNGFRIEDFGTTTGLTTPSPWMGNVSSVEIIKGPSSILYGRAEPGGAVNVLTNKPQATVHTTVTAGIGSRSDRWLAIDTTGAANEDKTVLYRLNVAEEDSNTWFRWNAQERSQAVAPALEWRVSPQTILSYEGLYRRVEGYSTNAAIPWDTASGQVATNDASRTYMPGAMASSGSNRSTLGLTHEFNESWAVSWKYMHDAAKTPKANYVWAGSPQFPITGGALTVSLDRGWNVYDLTTDATLLDMTGHVTAFGIKHTVLLGADYYKKRGHQRGAYDFGTQMTDYFNPALPDWNIPEQYQYELSSQESAFYLQDQMELPGNWHMLLGERYQHLAEDTANSGVADPHYTKSVALPRFGLLWQAVPWLSAYYSYSENMGSSKGARDFAGVLLKPESSKQHELGLKGEWLDGRLNALLAVFDLTKYNVAVADAAHPGFSISVGEVRSKGFEFNLQGAVTNNWDVLVNYSHANPVAVGDGNPSPYWGVNLTDGMTMPMVSTRTLGLWTSYRLPQEALRGWKIGGGYSWASAPAPYPVQPFPTSSHKTVSAFASYDTQLGGHKTVLQLNVNNLFNEKYRYMEYDPARSGIWNVTWGAPRQYRLSLQTEF